MAAQLCVLQSISVSMIKNIIFYFILGSICWSCEKRQDKEEYIDYSQLVYPLLDTENSRWFYFSAASRPFGMVNLTPDTELNGAWNSGYRYDIDTIKGFSHIHAWQLSGVSVMPVSSNEALDLSICSDYYSSFDHEEETVYPGSHQMLLDRYGLEAEITSTKRVGFHRYTFSEKNKAIIFNLGGPLGPSPMTDGELKLEQGGRITGSVVSTPTFRRPKPVKIYFVAELNHAVDKVEQAAEGKFLVRLDEGVESLLMKVAISYTSIEHASFNLRHEADHWDFDLVVEESRQEWNNYLSRIQVEGGSIAQRRRFYTDLWKALQGRRTISDANGYYPDNTGDEFRIGRVPVTSNGEPKFNHYNSDSFWGAQWTINTLWSLVYPEITEEFVNSLLQYYEDGGLIPRGPSGGNYTYVMTGASSTPFMVSAYQKGIRNFDIEKAYDGMKKNHLSGGIMDKAGYEHKTRYGGGMNSYIENGFVPYPIPEGKFGSHQDGPSLTMEYAYQDWTLAQLAKALDKDDDYRYFMNRSKNYQNVFDSSSNWMRPKDIDGNWKVPFDPYAIDQGFNESNGAQHTWFVPHDLGGLATLLGGKEKAVEKLNRQFEEAQKLGFTSGTAHAKETHPEYSRIPINYGNQPSIQTAFIFSHLGRPDLTQYWSSKVVQEVYEGLRTDRGYNGDEDQGLMGSLAVLMKMGLFQMNGGTDADPIYEVASPAFDKITIKLHPDYYPGKTFTIEAKNNSAEACYVAKKQFEGEEISGLGIRHSMVTKGGQLKLLMTAKKPQK